MKSNWNYPTTIWTGESRSTDLPEACLVAKIKNPLFVTDKDLITLPMTIAIINNLKKSFKNINTFSKFSGNPFGKNIIEGVELYNKSNCDGVIAFGGGSALDVGKGIAFMCGQTRPIWDFEDIGDHWKRADESKISPIIAIPTTAGTGSETGRASAIVNEETGILAVSDGDADLQLKQILNQTIKSVRDDMENLRFNTAIARITELNNELTKSNTETPREVAEVLVHLIAPLVPHIAEHIEKFFLQFLKFMPTFVYSEKFYSRLIANLGAEIVEFESIPQRKLVSPFWCGPPIMDIPFIKIPAFLTPYSFLFYHLKPGKSQDASNLQLA